MTLRENKHHYSWRNVKEANFLFLCSLFTLPPCIDKRRIREYIQIPKIFNKLFFYTLGKLQYKLISNAVKTFSKSCIVCSKVRCYKIEIFVSEFKSYEQGRKILFNCFQSHYSFLDFFFGPQVSAIVDIAIQPRLWISGLNLNV